MRSNELGFTAQLFRGEEEIDYDPNDGYVGGMPPGSVKLIINVEGDASVSACYVDGKKDITPATVRPAHGRRYYRRMVNVRKGRAGLETVYPSNAIRVISTPDSGLMRMWEVALIVQAGKLFLTCQQMYDAQCLRHEVGHLLCPFFQGSPKSWPQLVTLLRDLYRDRMDRLPAANGSVSKPLPPTPTVKLNGEGVVNWYSIARQVGMVYIRNGVAMVHADEISRPGHLRFFLPGEAVGFATLRRWRGSKPGMSFMAELINASPAASLAQ